MGRPKKEDKKIRYTVMLEPNIIDEMEFIAKRAEIPTATLARNLIKSGLDEAKLFDKFGLVRLVGSSRRKLDDFRKRFNITCEDIKNSDNDK